MFSIRIQIYLASYLALKSVYTEAERISFACRFIEWICFGCLIMFSFFFFFFFFFFLHSQTHEANNSMKTRVVSLWHSKAKQFQSIVYYYNYFFSNLGQRSYCKNCSLQVQFCISDLTGLFDLNRRAGLDPERVKIVCCGSHSTKISFENLTL